MFGELAFQEKRSYIKYKYYSLIATVKAKKERL